MNNFFRALIAGYGAKKLGGGCFGTIIVFILIWVALGQCSFSSRRVPPPQTFPAKHTVYTPFNLSRPEHKSDWAFESNAISFGNLYVGTPASKITQVA